MTGKVIAVNISEKKGVSKHPVDFIECVENFGINGDAHASEGIKRQVSLLGLESINKFRENKKAVGLCEGKFAENITTEGITLYELPVGTRLKIGGSIHEVSQIGKKCHADQGCEIARLYGQCVMPKEGIFTIVIKGGIVKAGDTIEII
jgi:MOSC domain-containing protein YiiM